MDDNNPEIGAPIAPAPGDNVITFPAPAIPSQTNSPKRKARQTIKGETKTKGETKKKKGTKAKQPYTLPDPVPHSEPPKTGPRGADGKTYKITNKQERFVQAYMDCNSAAQAYRQVYNVKNMKDASCHRAAHGLLSNAKVVARLAELKAERDAKTTLSRQWVLDRLMEHAEVCLGKKKVKLTKATRDGGVVEIETSLADQSAANRALELLGKEAGMFVDRRETGGPGAFAQMADDELRAYVAREMEEVQERKRTGTDG